MLRAASSTARIASLSKGKFGIFPDSLSWRILLATFAALQVADAAVGPDAAVPAAVLRTFVAVPGFRAFGGCILGPGSWHCHDSKGQLKGKQAEESSSHFANSLQETPPNLR